MTGGLALSFNHWPLKRGGGRGLKTSALSKVLNGFPPSFPPSAERNQLPGCKPPQGVGWGELINVIITQTASFPKRNYNGILLVIPPFISLPTLPHIPSNLWSVFYDYRLACIFFYNFMSRKWIIKHVLFVSGFFHSTQLFWDSSAPYCATIVHPYRRGPLGPWYECTPVRVSFTCWWTFRLPPVFVGYT